MILMPINTWLGLQSKIHKIKRFMIRYGSADLFSGSALSYILTTVLPETKTKYMYDYETALRK